jgi:hypothetical protein
MPRLRRGMALRAVSPPTGATASDRDVVPPARRVVFGCRRVRIPETSPKARGAPGFDSSGVFGVANPLGAVLVYGCGVTGLDADDCMERLREFLGAHPMPPIAEIVWGVDVSTLDPKLPRQPGAYRCLAPTREPLTNDSVKRVGRRLRSRRLRASVETRTRYGDACPAEAAPAAEAEGARGGSERPRAGYPGPQERPHGGGTLTGGRPCRILADRSGPSGSAFWRPCTRNI